MRSFIIKLLLVLLAFGCEGQMTMQQGPLMYSSSGAPLLFITAGQSNTEVGSLFTNIDLVSTYYGPHTNVKYWAAGTATPTGQFNTLYYINQENYASPLRTAGDSLQYANQFYLYPALANALGCTSQFPLYVCSQSVGDTDLSTYWNSTAVGNDGYDDFVSRVNACKAYLTTLYGTAPRVIFCLFDQGEKDGRDATKTSNYGTNLQDFVDDLRVAINEPNLKFIFPLIKLGSINGSPNPVTFGGSVNIHKQDVADADPTRIITTDSNWGEPSTDGVHFTANGQLDKNTGAANSSRPGTVRMSQLQQLINAGWIPGTASSAVPSGETYFNGCTSYVRFGDILDNPISSVDGTYRIGITVWNPPPWGSRTLVSKFTGTGNQRSIHWTITPTTISYAWYRTGAGSAVRQVAWTLPASIYDGNEHTLEIRYNGAVDTNDGLDRPDFYYDGVLYTTGKTLATATSTLGDTFSSSAQIAVGAIVNSGGTKDSNNFIIGGWAKDFFIKSGDGSTTHINCPDLSTGTDTSGNGNNGTPVDF